jgi:hypothetical protein
VDVGRGLLWVVGLLRVVVVYKTSPIHRFLDRISWRQWGSRWCSPTLIRPIILLFISKNLSL